MDKQACRICNKTIDECNCEFRKITSLQSECERLKAENELIRNNFGDNWWSKIGSDRKIQELQNENKKLRELVEFAYNIINIDAQTNKQHEIETNKQWLSDYTALSTAKEQQNKSVSNEGE